MKSMRSIIFGTLIVLALLCAVRLLLPGRSVAPATQPSSIEVQRGTRSARPRQTAHSGEPRVITALRRQRLSLDEHPTPSVDMSQTEPMQAQATAVADAGDKKAAPTGGKATPVAGATPGARPGKPPIQDPTARAALSFVGADPEAELYWYEAINDPDLPAQERQDLIEDLNEDGLSDPRHPTADDLPLILSRIQLIEEVGGDAMDEVNADAFLEAYKDLVNLAFQALENG